MKNVIFAAMMVFFAISLTGIAFGQEKLDCDAVYKKFTDNYKGPEVEKLRAAIAGGNEYLAKCSDQEDNDANKAFIAKTLPKLSDTIKAKKLEMAFEKAVRGKNWEDTNARGKELLAANHSASLDVMIVLASAGYAAQASNPPVNKFNTEAINYAKTVLQKIKDGAKSNFYGAFQFAYKTEKCSDGKNNVVSWMNYIIGQITYDHGNKLADAVPYFYKALDSACDFRDDAEILGLLGKYYSADAMKLIAARNQKIKDAGDQETDQTRADEALINGYLDRAIIAYAHAYKSEKSSSNTASIQALYKRLQTFIETRYEQPMDADKVIAEAFTRPLADPATPVVPIKDPEPLPPPPIKKSSAPVKKP